MNSAMDLQSELPVQLRGDLAGVKPPIEAAQTLPPVCYSDPGLARHELHRIFHRAWIGIGRADRWHQAGQYATLEVAGVPVIVLRDEHGELRAFNNACRHRASRLLEGSGRAKVIACPFHCWSYELNGRLRNAPKMERTKNFHKSDYGLVAFQVGERDGFVFLKFDHDGPSLDDWLGDFSSIHAPWSLGELVSTRRREFEVACNWKVFLEVFNEYYHLPYVHRHTINDIYALPDDADAVTGSYATQFGSTKGTGGLLEAVRDQAFAPIGSLTGRNRDGVRYTWIFPNMTFAASSDSAWIYEVFPLGPDRVQVGLTVCFPAETAQRDDFEARAQHYYDRLDTALAEDIPALERQQLGLASPYARQGRFSFLEPSVANFACWYAQRLMAA